MEEPGRNVKLRVLLNLIIAAVVLGLAAFFLIPGARERIGLGPAREDRRDSGQDPAPSGAAAKAVAELAGDAAKVAEEEAPAPEPEPLLRGRVLGEGQGIAGASVHLFGMKTLQETLDRLEGLGEGGGVPHVPTLIAIVREELEKVKKAAVTARTAEGGAYEFRRLDADSYYVLAFADGWLFRYGDVVSLAPGRTETLDLPLDRGATIAGKVVGASGNGLAGVAVTAEFRPGGSQGIGIILNRLLRYVNGEFLRGPFETRSGPDGSFTLDSLPPGIYDLVAVGTSGIEARTPGVQTGADDAVILIGKGASLRGLVTDAGGLPLPGVSFWLEREDEKLQMAGPLMAWGDLANSVRRLIDEQPRRVVAGNRGEIQAGPLAPGSYKLFLESAGFLPFARSFALDWGDRHDLGVIRLDGGESIAGTVLAEDGAPIEGANVVAGPAAVNFFNMGQAMDDFVSGKKQVRTDASGAFRLSGLAKGEYRLNASARGFGGAEKKGVATGGEPIAIQLEHGIRITGRVLDTAGEPIAGAEVKARQARARSAGDGSFELTGVATRGDDNPFGGAFGAAGPPAPKSLKVSATTSGYLQGEAELELASAGREVEIVLKKAPEILGRVVDGDRKPVPGSLVRLTMVMPGEMPDFIDSSWMFQAAGVSDLEGKFRLSGYKADEGRSYRVIADHPSFARGESQPLRLGADGEGGAAPGEVEVQLAAMARVTGKVTDGEQGVPGATVRLAKAKEKQGPGDMGAFFAMMGLPRGGDRAHSGRDGAFRYERLAAGTYTLSAEVAGFTESPEVNVTVGAGEEREVTLVVDAGGEIAGLVADPSGTAISGARVRLFREPDEVGEDQQARQMFEARKLFGGANKTARSREDGSFRFNGLAKGAYTIDARREGFSPGELKGLSPGDETHRLVLAPAAAIRGTVADAASGAPITSFRVRFAVPGAGLESGMVEGWREFSDPDGRFARADLDPGEREVQVAAPGYAPARKKLALAAGAVVEETFPLATAGRIRGAILDLATGRPIAGAQVSLSRKAELPEGEGGEAAAGDEKERASDRQARRRRDREEEAEARAAASQQEDAEAMGRHFVETWGAANLNSREDGSFLFDDVPEGAHRLVVSHERYIPDARDLASVAPGQEIAVEVNLREGLSLSGRVRDGSGKGVPGRVVFVRGKAEGNATVQKSAFSGEDGSYAVRGLEPGAYRVVIPGGRGPGAGGAGEFEAVEVDLRADVNGFDLAVAGGEQRE
jgi:hypothetical protein